MVSGCFATRAAAEAWIVPKQLSGVLTAYPLNCPIYSRSTQPYTALASLAVLLVLSAARRLV